MAGQGRVPPLLGQLRDCVVDDSNLTPGGQMSELSGGTTQELLRDKDREIAELKKKILKQTQELENTSEQINVLLKTSTKTRNGKKKTLHTSKPTDGLNLQNYPKITNFAAKMFRDHKILWSDWYVWNDDPNTMGPLLMEKDIGIPDAIQKKVYFETICVDYISTKYKNMKSNFNNAVKKAVKSECDSNTISSINDILSKNASIYFVKSG